MAVAEAVIVGPDMQACTALRRELLALAEEANHLAAEAFLAGNADQGALYLTFETRLIELAGGRS